MANVRQYIGARYVFKIYENSSDPSSAEWESGAAYEPLTIVTYLNSTYASKKDVPASVGDPASNPTYWVVTGAYNGQIAALQQQIDTINNTKIPSIEAAIQQQIDTINNTKIPSIEAAIQTLTNNLYTDDIIFIGDSYGLDAAIEDGGSAWASILQNVFTNATFLIEGGTGFASDTYISTNWLTMLTTYVNTLTSEQKDNIKQVIVIGGANDGNLIHNGTITPSIIAERINSFCEYVASNLPHAKVKCAFVGWYRTNPRHNAYLQARDAYASINKTNYAYYSDGEPILMGNDAIGAINNIHPLTDSSKVMANFISSVANNGNFKCSRTKTATIDNTSTSAQSVDHIQSINCYYDGDTCSVTLLGNYDNTTYFRMIFESGTTLAHDAYVIGNVIGTPVGAIDPILVNVNCIGFDDNGARIGYIPAVFTIQNNQLIVKFTNTSDQVRTLLIPWFTLTFNMRHS